MARDRNPQLRTRPRGVCASTRVTTSGEVREERPSVHSFRASTPVRNGGLNWDRWLNGAVAIPFARIELHRLVLIGDSPLPNRGVPRWLLYILNREIYLPLPINAPTGGRNVMTFDWIQALLRSEHRIGLRQRRELIIRRARSRFPGG